jgi:hypothetical protein
MSNEIIIEWIIISDKTRVTSTYEVKIKLLYIILLRGWRIKQLMGHNQFVGPTQLELKPNQSVHMKKNLMNGSTEPLLFRNRNLKRATLNLGARPVPTYSIVQLSSIVDCRTVTHHGHLQVRRVLFIEH